MGKPKKPAERLIARSATGLATVSRLPASRDTSGAGPGTGEDRPGRSPRVGNSIPGFLEDMDRINTIILRASDMDDMLSAVLEAMLDIFSSDRAWLVYPCDPDADFWEVKMERTRPEWPGATVQNVPIPMTPDAADLPRRCLASRDALRFDVASGLELPPVVKSFGVKAQMCMAIYPKVDGAWLFGIHHCALEQTYSDDQARLFEQIGHRIADSLNTLLVMRELKKSQTMHQEAQRLARIGHWELDLSSKRLTWSAEVHRMFETKQGDHQVTYEAFLDRVHPDDREMVDAAFKVSLETRGSYAVDHRLLMPDGRVKYVHELCRTDFDEAGRPLRSVGTVQDITERKQAENALWESQQRLQAIMDNTTAVVYLKDREGRYLLVNRRYEKLFHVRADDVVGLLDHDIFPADAANEFRANDLRVLAAGTALELEETVPQDDGDHKYISVKFPLFDNEGAAYAVCGISTDITDRKRAEELERLRLTELGHRTRLSIIGEMSAQIAHELHQPLSAIRSYSDACSYMLESPKPSLEAIKDVVKKIETQAERAGNIMSSVQHFAQKQVVRRERLDLNEVVQDTLKLMSIEKGHRRTMSSLELDEKLPSVHADRILIQQVLLNLMRNACRAMQGLQEDRCRLTIRTSRHSECCAMVSVLDTGKGMPADEIEHVFEAFYSGEKGGLGLGLALSRLIVESHGGRLWAEPNQGGGMAFHFKLPLAGGEGGC